MYRHGFPLLFLSSLVVLAVVVVGRRDVPEPRVIQQIIRQKVLGETVESIPTPTTPPAQTRFIEIVSPLSSEAETLPLPTLQQTTRPAIVVVNGPKELVEGNTATFTWDVTGPPKTIHSTTIFYGSKSFSGALTTNATPDDVPYTVSLKDFLDGDYQIPLRFIGNANLLKPGTYFYRAYALIDSKHYWSEESSFVVKQAPRHEVKIVNPPESVRTGENITFTWDVYGPSATMWYTVIAASMESKSGSLDTSIDLPKTPYQVLVNEFTTGPYTVPLRFIGNTKIGAPGVYYFRALAFINDKNIWSDEYSFSVE